MADDGFDMARVIDQLTTIAGALQEIHKTLEELVAKMPKA